MSSRLKEIRKYVNKKLSKIDDIDKRAGAIAHLNGVALAATLIAQKRGEDWELAAIAGLLHDMYAYESGSYDDHAHKGAQLAEKILKKIGVTTEEENEVICSAIYHHDDKLNTDDSPMDELLKDADAMHHIYNDFSKEVKEKELSRYEKLKKEFMI